MDVRIKLIPPPETPLAQKTPLTGEQPLAGAVVANLSPALADEMQLDSDWRGVVIVQIRRGSPAYRLGLRPGDIVAAVNGRKVSNVDALQAALRTAGGQWEINFRRDGQTQTLQIE
jgi:S1-C subfamily serine protease